MYDLSSFHPSLSIYTEQNETEKWMIRRDLRNRNWKSWEVIDWIKHDLQVKSTNMQSTKIQSCPMYAFSYHKSEVSFIVFFEIRNYSKLLQNYFNYNEWRTFSNGLGM